MFQTQRASLANKLIVSGSLCLMLLLSQVAQAQTRVAANLATTDHKAATTTTAAGTNTPAASGAKRVASTVRGVSVSKEGGTLVATIELDGEAAFNHFTLSDPLRVVVDIKGVRNAARAMMDVGQSGIERVRVAQRDDNVVRVVFDRTEKRRYEVEAEGDHILVWFGAKPATHSTTDVKPAASQPTREKAAPAPMPPASTVAKVTSVEPERRPELPISSKRNRQDWLKAAPATTRLETSSKNWGNASLDLPPAAPASVNNTPSNTVTSNPAPSNTVSNNTAPRNTAPTNTVSSNAPVNVAPASIPANNAAPSNTPSMNVSPNANMPNDERPFKASDYTKPGFTGEPIKLELKGVDIRDILRFIQESYKVNFVVDRSVAPDMPVTIGIDGVPWNQALDALLRSNRLGIQVEGEILRVMSQSAIAEEDDQRRKQFEARQLAAPLVTDMIRLKYAKASSAAAASSGAGAQIGSSSMGGSSSSSSGGTGGAQSGLDAVISSRLSPRGKIQADPRTNTLVITDIPENIAIVKDMIAKLDVPEPQVEIEARIVIANRTFARDLGVQLAAIATNPSKNGGAVFSTMPNPPVPTNLPPALGGTSGSSGGSSGSSSSNNGSVFGTIADTIRAVGASSVLGLTTGLSGTVQLSAILSAAENKGNIKTVSTPRITAQNNQTANVVNGVQIPVQTESNNTVTTTFVTAALKLEITPQITDDGTVVLRVVAENNSVNLAIAQLNPGGTPGINTQRAETHVLVPDGGTTIIGGITIDTESNAQQRTPGVSRIPGLGELFKRRQVSKSNDEILFFITPRIYRPLDVPTVTTGQTGSEVKK